MFVIMCHKIVKEADISRCWYLKCCTAKARLNTPPISVLMVCIKKTQRMTRKHSVNMQQDKMKQTTCQTKNYWGPKGVHYCNDLIK